MSPFEILKDWKSKPFKKTNYENIHAFYSDQKYIRMKPKSNISLSPGFLHLIIKHPKEWVRQNFKLEGDTTLFNETNKVLYYTIKECLFFDEIKHFKLHVKNGTPNDQEDLDLFETCK